MNTTRFFIFFTILQLFFIFIDFYTIFSWKKFVKKYKLNKYLYRIPIYIAILFLLTNAVNLYGSMYWQYSNSYRYIYMSVFSIWLLPKIGIVPFLLIKDFASYTKKIINKFSQNSNIIEEKEIDTSKRKLIGIAGWSLGSVPFIMVGNGLVNTTFNNEIRTLELKDKNIPKEFDGLKIVQISDLHLGSFFNHKPFQEVRYQIEQLKPDIICITGDFVNNKPGELKIAYSDLKRLDADIGVFACLGNHDHYMSESETKNLIKSLRETKIKLLINENQEMKISSKSLNISGVDNYGMNQFYGDFDKALFKSEDYDYNVLLCHDPRNWDEFIKYKKPVNLMLSGHTHGGQVAWEMFGLELKPVKMVYKQSEGHYSNQDYHLYVNRGIGTVGPPLRIGVRPEITQIILKS